MIISFSKSLCLYSILHILKHLHILLISFLGFNLFPPSIELIITLMSYAFHLWQLLRNS